MAERIYLIFLIVALMATSTLCIESLRRGRGFRTHRALVAGCVALSLWVAGTILESVSTTARGQWLGVFAIYTGCIAVPPSWYVLCRAIVSGDAGVRREWLPKWTRLGLIVPPLVLWLVLLTNPLHGLFIRGGSSPNWEYGPAWWVHNTYGFLLVGWGVVALTQHWRLAPRTQQSPSLWPLLGAVVLTTLGCLAWIVGIIPPAFNPSAPAFALVSALVGWSILGGNYLDALPLSAFAIFEHLGDGVVILDGQERIISANAAAARYLGLPTHSTTSPSFRQVAYVRFGWETTPESFYTGTPAKVEIEDGKQTLALAVQCVRFSPEDDAAVHTAVHMRDITVEHQAEQDLRRSETTYRLLYTDALDSIFTLDTMGRVIASNPAMERLGGYSQDDWATMTFTEVLLPESIESVVAAYRRALEGEEVTGIEYGMRCKDGNPLYLSANLRPVMQDGKIVRLEGISRDITQLRNAAAHEKTLEAQLVQEQKLGALGRMLAGVAHELNNPLTGILGYAELLTGELADNPELHQMADRILGGAEQCQAVVADLLRFAQNRPLEPEAVQLATAVGVACELERDLLSADNITVETHIDEDLWVHADAAQFQLCLVNLIVNARDAMSEVINNRRLRFRSSNCNGHIELTVEDTGPGIPPDVAQRMFDPFYTTKELGRGTGLGLSLCHSAMEKLAGSIRYDSRFTAGARFILRLPSCAPPATNGTAASAEDTPARGGRILLADDNADIRDFCADCLESGGYEVLTVENGKAVLSILKTVEVDLIVSDIRMPTMDGPTLYAELQRLENPPAVVFITGDAVREETRTFLSKTDTPYLLKPFRTAQLLEVVGQELAGHATSSPAPEA